MAKFRISSSGLPGTLPSVSTNVDGTAAFFGASTPEADILIVDQGAYLISTGNLSRGAELNGPGAWTVTVNGFVQGTQVGLYLIASNPNVSKITIGLEGSVLSGFYAIEADSAATISNAGTVSG